MGDAIVGLIPRAVAGTQAAYLVASLVAMAVVLTAAGMGFCAVVHPGLLDVGAFVELNFTVLMLSVALGAVTFFVSCASDESKTAIGVSAAILVGFFVISVIARIGHEQGVYAVIDRFSIYTLVKARAIIEGEANQWLSNGLLALFAVVGIGGGLLVFSRRDLPL